MKRTFLVVAMLIMSACLSYAQKPEKGGNQLLDGVICTPDCPNDKFTDNPMQSVTFVIGGCHYTVDFYYRKACSTYCDLLIWRVKCWEGTACMMNVSTLLDIATARALTYMIAYLNPPMDCGPTNIGDCVIYWRLSRAACWHWFENSNFNPLIPVSISNYWGGISYCDTQVGCFTQYKVCMDQFGQLSVTAIQHTSTGTCPYDPSPSFPCTPACGD